MIFNILTVGEQVLILFILIGTGFFLNKTNFFSKRSIKDITTFVLYIVTPCVIIKSYTREFDMSMFKGLIITAGAAFFSFAINIILAHLLFRDKDKHKERVYIGGAVFSNCAFMSLPLQQALLGEEGVFYGATFVAVFNIVLWTYGVYLMSGDKKSISLKNIWLTPGIIGTIIGLIILFSPFKPPRIIMQPIEYLAALNTPLPMIIIGYHLADTVISLKDKKLYFTIFFRLCISPLILLFVMVLFNIKGTVLIASIIAASAPVAATVTMFCEKFGQDTSLSAVLVSASTIISILTMPLIVGVASLF